MKKNKIAFVTLGCKLNYAETSTYEREFIKYGLQPVDWTEDADIFLVNTCTVTEHSDKKCRNIIRKLHRLRPSADIVVTGCYAQMKKEEIGRIEGVSRVFGAEEKSMVVPSVMAGLAEAGNLDVPDICGGTSALTEAARQTFFPAYSTGERTRSFLKVQDGCDYFCAYCTVPYARGRSRNLPVADIVRQAEEIAAAGVKEIVLTGVNTGDFGKSTGESFAELLKALDKVNGIERYRISSVEPNLLTEEIVDWIASGTRFLPHFHIPLQSGSDTVLHEMGRRYDTAAFEAKIDCIRRKMEKPGALKVFFGIDVIAGFPGETDSLFQETYSFLKERIRPAFIHVFPYSRRAGTRAAARRDQVQDSVKTERVRLLEELSAGLHQEFIDSHRGMKAHVLFESSEKDGMMAGYTENYIRVERPFEASLTGKIAEVTL